MASSGEIFGTWKPEGNVSFGVMAGIKTGGMSLSTNFHSSGFEDTEKFLV